MADVKGLTVEISEVSQLIDLESWTGVDTSIDQDLQGKISQEVIDYMKQRVVEKNKGIGEKKLKSPYSKTYQNSLDFDAAGKSANDINMTLHGDMLGSIDVMSENGSMVLIGIDDITQTNKAYGHQSGFEGHPNEDKMKKYKREFFGITKEEFNKHILPKFKSDIESIKENKDTTKQEAINIIRNAGDLFR